MWVSCIHFRCILSPWLDMSCVSRSKLFKRELTPAGPKMPPFQSVKKVSPESTRPKLIDISPWPFSLFSSSSRSLKFRGTITVSPAGVLEDMLMDFGFKRELEIGENVSSYAVSVISRDVNLMCFSRYFHGHSVRPITVLFWLFLLFKKTTHALVRK